MGSVNKVIIVGCLDKDPEIRITQRSGVKVVTLNVATRESWLDQKSGDWREHTAWHRVVIMNEALGAVAAKNLRKGAQIYVEGKLLTRQWTDPGGVVRFTAEINVGRHHGTLTLLEADQGSEGEGQESATFCEQKVAKKLC
jgi:single-strand DNA-binding protein